MTLAVEEFRQLLADRGYRVTAQRLAIYELLQANARRSHHPSAEELYQQARQRFPMISPATVYNTLELLVQLGLASQLGFPGDVQRYDGNPHAHANVQCVKCKEIFDVDAEALEDLGKRVAERSHFVILGQRFEFYGICPRCQRAGAPETGEPETDPSPQRDPGHGAGPADRDRTGSPLATPPTGSRRPRGSAGGHGERVEEHGGPRRARVSRLTAASRRGVPAGLEPARPGPAGRAGASETVQQPRGTGSGRNRR